MPTLPKPSQLINCSNLSSCLQNLYNLLFAIFVAMAFLYFLFGAFQYLLSGAGIYKKEEGKNKMKNSIIALIIVLVTPIILNMINPGIFKAELQIPTVILEYEGEDHMAPPPPGPPKAGFVTIGSLGLKCIHGRNDVQISETIVPKIRNLDQNLCKMNMSAIITSGLSPRHTSRCHTLYGTCIDMQPVNAKPVNDHCQEWRNFDKALQGITSSFIRETNEGTCINGQVLTKENPCCIIKENYCDLMWKKCLKTTGPHIHANL